MKGNNNAIDVLLVGSYPPPHGGQSIHIESLYSYLKDGLRVRVVNTGVNKNIQECGIRSVTSSKALLKTVLCDYKMRLLHLHVSNVVDFGKLVPVYAAAAVKGFKWIMTIHSGNIESTLERLTFFEKILVKIMLSRVDKIICVNNKIMTLLSKWTKGEKLDVIPAFSIRYAEKKLPEEVEIFINTHDPVVTCVGFYEPVYGLDFAILSILQLRRIFANLGLIIIGDKRNASNYEDMIHENRLDNHVLLCDNIDHSVCLSMMSKSALFLRPTMYDGDSISVREALSLGVPVAASRTEFRPPGVVIFERGDLQDMVKKMTSCLAEKREKYCVVEDDCTSLERVKKLYVTLLNGGS